MADSGRGSLLGRNRGQLKGGGGSATDLGPEWMDESASDTDVRWAWLRLFTWTYTRMWPLMNIAMGSTIGTALTSLFGLELVLSIYFYWTRRYFPGSVYNQLHVVMHKRKMMRIYTAGSFSAFLRFVFGAWGYFVVLAFGANLNAISWRGTLSTFILVRNIGYAVACLFSLKEVLLYVPIIVIWYAVLSFTILFLPLYPLWWAYNWLAGHSFPVPYILSAITRDDCTFDFPYKYVYEHLEA